MSRSNTPLTQYQRDIIKFLHRKGTSARAIAEENDLRKPNGQPIDVRTVRYWIKRLEETGEVDVKPRSGRPRALNSAQEKELVDYIREHDTYTYRKVKRKKRLRTVSVRTVNRYALRHRLRAFRAVKKPPLSPANEKQRLDFANHLISNPDLLDELIFSDEKLFKGGPSNRVVLVRRERSKKGENKAYQPQYVKHFKRPSANADCNIWLYICPLGKGDIFCAENHQWFDENGKKRPDAPKGKPAGFDNPSYTEMLEKRAIPSINRRMMTCTFIQDNSRVHTSKEHEAAGKTTADVLRRHNIETIEFPPNSPDLHPVEHAHKLLQDAFNEELDRRIRKPKNKADTFALLQYCWNNLVDNQKIVNIYNSIRSKCLKTIEHKGANNFKG